MKICPFCAEEVKLEAIKCKHCGEFFDQKPSRDQILSEEKIPVEQGEPKSHPGLTSANIYFWFHFSIAAMLYSTVAWKLLYAGGDTASSSPRMTFAIKFLQTPVMGPLLALVTILILTFTLVERITAINFAPKGALDNLGISPSDRIGCNFIFYFFLLALLWLLTSGLG